MKFDEQKINEIRGKMLVNAASREELSTFLYYVSTLEGLLEDVSYEDFFDKKGWQYRVFNESRPE